MVIFKENGSIIVETTPLMQKIHELLQEMVNTTRKTDKIILKQAIEQKICEIEIEHARKLEMYSRIK